jgi:hypothetical protein
VTEIDYSDKADIDILAVEWMEGESYDASEGNVYVRYNGWIYRLPYQTQAVEGKTPDDGSSGWESVWIGEELSELSRAIVEAIGKADAAYSPDNPPPTPDMGEYAKKSDVEEAVADKAFRYEVEEAKQVAGEAQGRAEAAENLALNAETLALNAENLALKVEEDVKAALPRYLITTMSPTSEGHLIIYPFYLTLCQFESELPETLTISLMDGEDYGNPHTYAREYILVVDLVGYYSSPRIEWGGMRPRTDAETDFACVAGVRNVYWISEYAEGEFVVAGWQETEGGNAE